MTCHGYTFFFFRNNDGDEEMAEWQGTTCQSSQIHGPCSSHYSIVPSCIPHDRQGLHSLLPNWSRSENAAIKGNLSLVLCCHGPSQSPVWVPVVTTNIFRPDASLLVHLTSACRQILVRSHWSWVGRGALKSSNLMAKVPWLKLQVFSLACNHFGYELYCFCYWQTEILCCPLCRSNKSIWRRWSCYSPTEAMWYWLWLYFL